MVVLLSSFAGVSVYSHDLIAKKRAPQIRSEMDFSETDVDTLSKVVKAEIGRGACWFGGGSSCIYLMNCLFNSWFRLPSLWRIGSLCPFAVKVADILKTSERTVVPLSSSRAVLPAKLCLRQCAKPLNISTCLVFSTPQRYKSRLQRFVNVDHFLKLP